MSESGAVMNQGAIRAGKVARNGSITSRNTLRGRLCGHFNRLEGHVAVTGSASGHGKFLAGAAGTCSAGSINQPGPALFAAGKHHALIFLACQLVRIICWTCRHPYARCLMVHQP